MPVRKSRHGMVLRGLRSAACVYYMYVGMLIRKDSVDFGVRKDT